MNDVEQLPRLSIASDVDQLSASLISMPKLTKMMTRSSYKFCILIYRVQPGANCKIQLLSLLVFLSPIFLVLPSICRSSSNHRYYYVFCIRLVICGITAAACCYHISSSHHLKVFSHAHQTNWEPVTVLGKSGTPSSLRSCHGSVALNNNYIDGRMMALMDRAGARTNQSRQ